MPDDPRITAILTHYRSLVKRDDHDHQSRLLIQAALEAHSECDLKAAVVKYTAEMNHDIAFRKPAHKFFESTYYTRYLSAAPAPVVTTDNPLLEELKRRIGGDGYLVVKPERSSNEQGPTITTRRTSRSSGARLNYDL